MNMAHDEHSMTWADLETIWAAIDSFYHQFSPQEWSRKHGKEWTFADMPYHLAYFNQAALDGIQNNRRENYEERVSVTAEEHNFALYPPVS